MAHHLHTKKAIRQNEKRNRRNRADKSKMRSAIKSFLESEKKEDKEKALKLAQINIDRAAKKNIIHWKTAARKKSQLSRAYNEFVKAAS